MPDVATNSARKLYGSKIVATGMCVPDKVVTNSDLAKIIDTSDEWIRQRTGIEERRHVDDVESPSDLALKATQQALSAANLQPSDLDLILVATLTPEHYFPGTSVYLQHKLGLSTTPAMDVRCQCTGFIYGLQTAHAMIASGLYRRVLLCGVEIHSRALDFTNRGRDICVLFGDGAGAFIMERTTDYSEGVLSSVVHAQGEHAESLIMRYPSLAGGVFLSAENFESGAVYPEMDGRTVFKHAVTRMPEVVREVLEKEGVTVDDIDLFVFHQANLRINDAVLEQLGVSPDRAFNNIMRYGNCSAASIPLCLHEAKMAGRLKQGDLVCICGFGAGFTWGAAIIRWS